MFDINVLVDMLSRREPFSLDASRALSLATMGKSSNVVCSHGISTLYYLLRKEYGHTNSVLMVDEILSLMEVAVQPKSVFHAARALKSSDFEDDLTAATAKAQGCDFIVTRDRRGFMYSPVPSITPSELWSRYS